MRRGRFFVLPGPRRQRSEASCDGKAAQHPNGLLSASNGKGNERASWMPYAIFSLLNVLTGGVPLIGLCLRMAVSDLLGGFQ
jgi:hypothetical protein